MLVEEPGTAHTDGKDDGQDQNAKNGNDLKGHIGVPSPFLPWGIRAAINFSAGTLARIISKPDQRLGRFAIPVLR